MCVLFAVNQYISMQADVRMVFCAIMLLLFFSPFFRSKITLYLFLGALFYFILIECLGIVIFFFPLGILSHDVICLNSYKLFTFSSDSVPCNLLHQSVFQLFPFCPGITFPLFVWMGL